jgi:hypothetical protein
MLAAASESHAQKGSPYGYGGYGYAGQGYGHGGYGYGHGHGYGAYGYGNCGPHGCHGHGNYHGAPYNLYSVAAMAPPAYQAGPPTAAVTYPYYTVRGPRDFLQDACGPNPILPYRRPTICLPSIGP